MLDTHLRASFLRQLGKAGTEKVKKIWILMKQEIMGWQCHQLDNTQIIFLLQTQPRQHLITQFFYRPDTLPDAQPTVSKH